MAETLEKFILQQRPYCEFPAASGVATCMNPATRVIVITGGKWSYQAAVCEECARYAVDEQKQRWP